MGRKASLSQGNVGPFVSCSFFEVGFMFVSVPMVMWMLKLTFIKALALDVSFLVVIPVYTVLYNWFYDLMFPVEVFNE